MIRFFLGVLVGVLIGSGIGFKVPEIHFDSPTEAIKDGVREASKEIIKEELEEQKKEFNEKEEGLMNEINKLLEKI